MLIRDFKFSQFSLMLKEPLRNASFTIESRKGFIVKIVDENNFIGYGEVSPLPGFSAEPLDECEAALNRLYYSIISKSARNEEFDLITELHSISNLPSLLFGIEQAVISLLIQRGELSSILRNEKRTLVNGIVGIKSKDETFREIDSLLIADFKTIKIKLGVNSVEDDVEFVKNIATRVDDSIKIRLDVNGNWNYQQAEFAVNNLPQDKIELLEQPVNNINELIMLSDFSRIPIAIDESIRNVSEAKKIIERSNITTIVLKPSILGSIIQTISLIKSAESLGKKIIISSAFESVVGRSALVLIASFIKGNYAHGLNTANHFIEDLATDDYLVSKGEILFNPKTYPPKFNGLAV
ncbi:MAG: o-succinylbenzoate synthase [Melioribacteraceae bacterium]|nr:o-succinylbenzoate synthase [Melioribacteraceae bacterium]